MKPPEKTRQTYRQIAAAYAEAQQDRAHLLAQLEQFMQLVPEGGIVLDVGCGPGWDTAVFQSRHFSAIGLDYSLEMMQTGKEQHQLHLPFAQADMRHLPIPQAAVAGLWCCASLLHLEREDVLPTLQEFWRVLVPDGILYVAVKLGAGEGWVPTSYGQPLPRFFTYWQPETLDPLLETAAFHIIDGWEEPGRQTTWLVRYARKKRVQQ